MSSNGARLLKTLAELPLILWLLLALLFGLVNRLLELRHCGDRRRIQRVRAH